MNLKKHFQMHHPSTNKYSFLGVIEVLLGWVLISFTMMIYKVAGHATPTFYLLFWQFLFMFIALLPIIFLRGVKVLKPKKLTFVLLRGFFSVLAYYLFIKCSTLISLVDNALLFNTEALFVPILLWAIYRKKIDVIIWVGLIIGFLGVGVIYRPTLGIINIGALGGLGAGLFTAIVVLLTSVIINYKESALTVVFYHALLSIIIYGALAIPDWRTPNLIDIVYAIITGGLFAFALYLFVHAFHYTESHIIGGLSYSLVLFAGILEWLIWREAPTIIEVIGFVLILLGGVIIIHHSNHLNSKNRKFFL